MFRTLGLRFKITLLFVLIFGSCLCANSIYLYSSMAATYEEEFDIFLYNFAVEMGEALESSFLGEGFFDYDKFKEQKLFPFSSNEVLVQVRFTDGTPFVQSRKLGHTSLPLSSGELNSLKYQKFLVRSWQPLAPIEKYSKYRLMTYLVVRGQIPQFILQLAAPDRIVLAKSRQFRNILLFSVPLILLLSAVLGYYFSYFAVAPVKRIIRTAKAIDVNRLSARVPVSPSKDELSDLAVTLNNLLDRLENSFRVQEQFVADASHQLKTPLTIMKSEIEQLRNLPEMDGELAAKVESIREEIDYLSHLVTDLLMLAKVESGGSVLEVNSVRLDEIVVGAIEKTKRLADKENVTITINFDNEEVNPEADFTIKGDAGLLTSMFQSIIENGIKYSPKNSKMEVFLGIQNASIVTRVCDSGPGINNAEAELIFERFYRGRSTQSQVHGSGLGLAIAKKIANLHQATLYCRNRPTGGAEVVFQIRKGES